MININLLENKGLILGFLYIISTIVYITCIFIKFNFIKVTLKNFNTVVLISMFSFALITILKIIIIFTKDIHASNNRYYFTMPLLINHPIIITLFILIMITIISIKIISFDFVWELIQDSIDITNNTLTILLNVSKYAVFANALTEIFIVIFSIYKFFTIHLKLIIYFINSLYKSNKDKIKKKISSKTNKFLNKMKTTVQKTIHLRILLNIDEHKFIIKKEFNNNITIFDIRTTLEIRNGHICNSILLYDFANNYEAILKYKILDLIKLNKKDIIIYDSNGKRSLEIAELLHSKGFLNKIFIIQNGGYNDLAVLLEPHKVCKLCR